MFINKNKQNLSLICQSVHFNERHTAINGVIYIDGLMVKQRKALFVLI